MDDDQQRCNKQGIPESERSLRTKKPIGSEIVEQGPVAREVRFAGLEPSEGLWQWSDFSLLGGCGHTFLVDVHKSFVVYALIRSPHSSAFK